MEQKTEEDAEFPAAAPPSRGLQVRRIYGATVFLMTGAFLLFAVSSWFETRQSALQELAHASRMMRDSTAAVLGHQESMLRVLGRRLEDLGALHAPAEGRRLMDLMLSLNEVVAGFGLARPDGQLVLVSGIPPDRPLPNLREQEPSRTGLMEALDHDGMVVGRTYYFPLLERWLIPVRIALRDHRGDVVMVMAAGIDIDADMAMWNSIDVKPGMEIMVLRADGLPQLVLPARLPERAVTYGTPVAVGAAARGGDDGGGLTVDMAIERYPLRVVARYDGATVAMDYFRHMSVALLLFAAAMVLGWVAFRLIRQKQQQYEDDLIRQATHDRLTRLPNRLMLEDRLRQEIRRVQRSGCPLAVMYVDLDQFKRVNDSFGHAVGDGLLLAAAQRLSACLRAGDTVGRLGGDEFLLLFPDLHSVADVRVLADRVLEAFDGRVLVEGHELFTTASIGVAMCPDDGTDSGTLLQNADTALYRAKDAGRNSVRFFRPEYSRAATRRVVVEHALHLALEQEELRVVYQPKCDARSRRWVGAEALLRWHSATLGEVSPAEFIPVAEDTGLIAALGHFVLVRALEDLVHIQTIAPAFTMAVNVSVRQFNSPHLVTGVMELLEEFGVAPAMLELEVTESIMAATVPQLDLLREAGLRLAIDDFGTGFSSLSYLKRLPVTTLKLDRVFVRDLESDAADKALLKAMIRLAQELDLETVAEGVETAGQASFLQQQGVSQLQGYLLARPMAVDELLVCLEEPAARSSR